ncbi:MAG: PadR family transcriptional regulator [Anaerolineales bacterium]
MRVIEPMVLLLLAQEPSHGYRLVERLEEAFGVVDLPAQTVYRVLQHLEEAEWITSTWDTESAQGPPRKVYEITTEGLEALDMWSQEIQELQETLDSLLGAYRRFKQSPS